MTRQVKHCALKRPSHILIGYYISIMNKKKLHFELKEVTPNKVKKIMKSMKKKKAVDMTKLHKNVYYWVLNTWQSH